ncbi:aminotransferase class IV [Nonomuraea basaltis]|uniref:aminotransferase class IV n=1 Tax=Nonomuraea basaltis TaxID=2495887 RepID=UPI00197FADA9|nr:aminotransferase class IV [Nonomuraea basaltis]
MDTISVFAGGEFIAGEPIEDDLLVADSWLVVDGAVRFLADHGRRFRAACEAAALAGDLVAAMWRAAVDALPREGDWFPRVELSASGELRFRVRTAPARGGPLAVWARPPGDPRRVPHVKGPDLATLARLRAEAQRHGAHEALIVASDGWVVEGATTSLLWWEDDTLCVPSSELPALPGVTTARLQRRAAELGIPVTHRRRRPQDLAGRETWLVNALHGIRPVQRWAVPELFRPGPVKMAPSWQAWLAEQAAPLPSRPAQ